MHVSRLPSARAQSKSYSLSVDAPAASAGKPASARVTLTPGAGMHVNTEYPTSMTLKVPDGVDGAAAKLKPAKIDKTQALFEVAYTARDKGDKILEGTVNFVVCNDAMTECVPRREPVQIKVTVK